MEDKIFKLLVKKISGELTDDEKKEIDILIDENKNIAKEYGDLQEVWNLTKPLNQNPDINKFKRYLNKKQAFVRETLKYAAVVLFFVFSFTFIFTHKKEIIIKNNENKNLVVDLPDNSTVILKQNACLSYKISLFSSFNRKVNLTGTAFFDVNHNGKKFFVQTSDLHVVVTGTKFNVEQNNSLTEVTLVQGKVIVDGFRGKKDTSVTMLPGEIVTFYHQSKKIIHKKTNPFVQTYWLNDKIYFNNFSMDDLALIMKKYYGKILIFDDTSSNRKHIGGSAPTDDVNIIIRAISMITKTDTVIKKDTIIFTNNKNQKK